jgi:hypothetical protein
MRPDAGGADAVVVERVVNEKVIARRGLVDDLLNLFE